MSIIRKDIPCVYFYMKDNEVLYIGKSYNLKARHREHIKRHDLCLNNYNKLAVQYYSSQIILPSIELFYISLFDPIYNQRDKYVLEDEHIDNYWRIIETFFIEECTYSKEDLDKEYSYNEQVLIDGIHQKLKKMENGYKGGRPITPAEIINKITEGVKNKTYTSITEACRLNGIGRNTYYTRKRQIEQNLT